MHIGSNAINWQRNKDLLVSGSEAVIREYISRNPRSQLCAIGYVFEMWNAHPQFDLCANTREHLDQSIASCRVQYPHITPDEIRWNSGDFEWPAGLLLPYPELGELGAEWLAEINRLHRLVEEKRESLQPVVNGLMDIGCEAMAELYRRGVLSRWSELDYNVSHVNDGIELVKDRDRKIRLLISQSA